MIVSGIADKYDATGVSGEDFGKTESGRTVFSCEGAYTGAEDLAHHILKRIMCAQSKAVPFKVLDITLSQRTLLSRLVCARESGVEVTMTDLSVMLGGTKSAASQAVSKLERRGLVRRSWAKGDRRRILVALTPKGETIADAFNRDMLEFIQSKLDKIEGEELSLFIRLFEKCME
ncbi:MAG: MarR family transcriptional regulator [Firmicutes bacterium]|nr:MarR family transcriptional regulator [Bacillota bacterium]